MADGRQIARQWLEAEAAFGVTEVPIPLPAPPAAPVAPPARPVPVVTTAYGARPALRPVPARPAATPVPPSRPPAGPFSIQSAADAVAPKPQFTEDAMARKKAAGPLLPIPTEDFTALPPLTREEKIAQLAALESEAQHELSAHLNEISTRVVFGEGDPDAALLFVGEGPGIDEDRLGRPFVGRSGQLLDKMINAIGLQRSQVYIANVVKLRAADPDPTNDGRLKDRPPNPDEVARGLPFLQRQIRIVRPKVIVTLGAPAIKHLTGETEGVMKIRGSWRAFCGIPVMPTYHPSFVLRSYTEENRRNVWNDLKAALQRATE